MSQEWMIDVLIDLRKFAEKNDMPRLSEQLDDTIHIAASAIAENVRKSTVSEPHDNKNGSVHRTYQL